MLPISVSIRNKEEMDAMDYGDKSYDEPISTEMLEDVSVYGIHALLYIFKGKNW